jgi:HAD superfamily hydrolase (TIGR01493 family)
MPPVVVFDALGTLFDLGALDPSFREVGGNETTRRAWFQRLLDSARCLTILDAAPALDLLAEAGVSCVVLSNGSCDSTRKLIRRAGLEGRAKAVYSVEQVRAYKPDPRPYRLVANEEATAPADLTLIAAHGWDVLGAHGAGLGAVWLDRDELEWPFPIALPGMQASDLVTAAESAFQLSLTVGLTMGLRGRRRRWPAPGPATGRRWCARGAACRPPRSPAGRPGARSEPRPPSAPAPSRAPSGRARCS